MKEADPLADLMDAISYTARCGKTAAKRAAYLVLDILKEDGTINDLDLETEERSVFYDLEDAGCLKQEWPDRIIINVGPKKGRYWEGHFWTVRTDNVSRLAELQRRGAPEVQDDGGKTYARIPENEWQRRDAMRTEAGHVTEARALY